MPSTDALREIVPDILTWPWYSERFGYDFNGYLVRHAAGNLCVDPVEAPDAVLDALTREGVAAILLTNRNHYRDAARVKARTGARVLVHPADADFVRSKGVSVDGELLPGGAVGPFTLVDAAGKSPGEVALHWPERRLLVVGDACVGKVPGELGLLPEAVMDDPAALRRALVRIADTIDCDTLLVCDGHPLLTGGREALRELVARFYT